MKLPLFLFAIVAAAAAGYFLHPALYDFAEKNRSRVIVKTVTAPTAPQTQAAGSPGQEQLAASATAEKPATTPADAAQEILNKMQTTDPKATTTTYGTTEGAVEDEFDRKYPLPKFKAITEITRDWMSMPAKAFPRRIIAKEALVFAVAGGKATLPAGSEVSALAMDNGLVTVARTAKDSNTTQLALAKTNLQELMTTLYDAYIRKMNSRVIAMRQAARDRKNAPPAPVVAVDERVKLAGPEPTPDADGRVPEMVASMANGEITEIKLSNVVEWGQLGFEKDGSKGYWSCSLTARLSTIFGEVDTDVTAWMANGKVVRWFFTGSKEPVN
jgi:hypothetical protein